MKSKALIIGLMTLAVASAVAATSFDRANVLRDELRLHHVEGKKEAASQLATKLASSGNNEPFVQATLQEELRGLDTNVTMSNLDKDVKFITGRKTETYCEGQGLVELTGEHGDGSTSHVVLLRSNRHLIPGSLSQIESGDWAYELTDSYRRPSVSELWTISGSTSSYHIKEVRNNPNGKSDTGDFSASWMGNKSSASFGTQGDGAEPMHNYMSLDFQIWGNQDLGYKIKFEPGFKSSDSRSYESSGKNVFIEAERTVGDVIGTMKTKDSHGAEREYRNCFPVKYVMTLKKIEDRQLEIDGKINVEKVKSALKKNRGFAVACYKKAREMDATISGLVTVGWDIGDDGGVSNVHPTGRSLTGSDDFNIREEMIKCIVDTIATWKFPMAAEGTTAHVSYPFTFKK